MSNDFIEIYQRLKKRNNSLLPTEIKSIRRSYKMTQMKFADILKISYGTYKNWEIGHRYPSSPATALLRIAQHYPELFLSNQNQFKKLY